MRRWRRLAIASIGVPLLAVYFVCLSSILTVREAIGGGAIEQADNTCLTPRDKLMSFAGANQRMADWWTLNRIRAYRGDLDPGIPTVAWHTRGAIIQLGLALTTSPQQRIDRVEPVLQGLRECGQPPQA